MNVTTADEQEIVEKLQQGLQQRAELQQRLSDQDAYLLRLEGALAFIRSKLVEDGEEPVQAAEEATATT